MLPFLLFDYHYMTWQQWATLLLAGACAAGGQFSITAAYTHAPSREISVYDYAQVIFAAIVGYAVICGMALWMFFYNRKADGTAPAKKV